MQPKFTPAPWKLETESRSPDGSDLLVTTADGAWNVADCRDHNGLAVDSVEQAEANARLIAAAPDLFEALADCIVSLCAANLEHLPSLAKARAALSKAEGRDEA